VGILIEGARTRRIRTRLGALSVLVAASVSVALAAAFAGAAPARATSTVTAAQPAPLTWSSQVSLESAPYQDPNPLGAISCPSARFCVSEAAVAGGEGVLTSTNPAGGASAWSAPKLAFAKSNPTPTGLSCPTSAFCAQLDGSLVFTSTAPASGKRWAEQRLANPDGGFYGLSCPSARLCVATGAAGEIATSTDPGAKHPTWHVVIKRGFGRIDAVSCPTASFCAAVSLDGDVLTSSHPAAGLSAWKVTDADGSVPLTSVSCPSAGFCSAQDNADRFVYSADPAGGASRWHAVAEPFANALALTCKSASFCVDLLEAGTGEPDLAWSTDPTAGPSAWSQLSLSQYGPAAISCGSASFCAVTGSAGDVVTSSDPASSAPTWTPAQIDGYTDIEDVDCPGARLCLAADATGHLFTSTDPAGGRSAWHAADVSASSITCPTATFCAALGGSGVVELSDDPSGGTAAWQSASAPAGLSALSCPSPSLCVAFGLLGSGDAAVYTSADPADGASAWQSADLGSLDGAGTMTLTCPTVALCVGAGGSAVLTSTDPAGGAGAWQLTSFSPLDIAAVGQVSCPTSSLCVALAETNDEVSKVLNSTDPAGGIGAWHLSRNPVIRQHLLDCPTAAECYQVGADEGIAASTDPAASQPSWLVSTPAKGFYSLSCPTVSLCVGGSLGGYRGGVQVATPPHPGASQSRLKVSATKITYGHERTEHLTATVSPLYPQYTAVPPGHIVIASRKQTLCRLTLSHGRASCTLARYQLRPGSYWLRVRYLGNREYAPSQSALIRVNVVR
jgi:hypothetical protein